MTSMKPELLRKMVSDSRSLSPPLINREPKSGSVNEMDILYNRVDQQVELISVLKQRLDEMTKRWQRSEAEQEQQENERSKIQQAHNKLADKHSNLEIRWNQLSENHGEMIVLKDDYKDKCNHLKERLKQLEAGESAAVSVEQQKYGELLKVVSAMREDKKKHVSYESTLLAKIASLEETISRMAEREKYLVDELELERNKHLTSVSQLQLNLNDTNSLVHEKGNQNEVLSREVKKLTEEIISRGKIVQDKESHIKDLESQKAKFEEKNNSLSKELDKLNESINSNRIVTDIKEQLVDMKESYRRLDRELGQFKAAAKEELRKEQSVNAELRHMSISHNRNN